MRILLLEDDPDLNELIARGLRNEGYATDRATTVAEAAHLLSCNEYDVGCFDLNLPDGDGLSLIARLGDDDLPRPLRIIALTARDSVQQRIAGLDAGADDYLVKPFAFGELLARLRALARREDHAGSTLVVGELVIDLATHRVERAGSSIELTTREFALLRYLAHHADDVLSAERLLEHVWDENADPMSTVVRVMISRVRRKLGEPTPITTVEGAGYRLDSTLLEKR